MFTKNRFFASRGIKLLIGIPVGIIIAVLIGLLFGYFIMLLWNWLMPSLFHLSIINFWQAVGLVILIRLLFGSWNHDHSHDRKKYTYEYCDEEDNRFFKDLRKKEFRKNFARWWKEKGESQFYNERGKNEKENPDTHENESE